MLINYEMQLRVRNLTPTLSPSPFFPPSLVQFLIKNRWQQIRNPSRDTTRRANWVEGGGEIGGAAIPIRFWQNISAFELLLPFLLARPRAEQQPML